MSMRETWKAAKKTAVADHGKAYTAWLKDQKAKSLGGDKKAGKTVETENISKLGQGKGFDYTKPMAFEADLGPGLDKIESTHKAAEAAIGALTLQDVIKKKKVAALWKTYAEKVNFTAENYHFLTAGHKLPAARIYDEYVKSGSKYELNLDSGLKRKWAKVAEKGDWKAAKPLVAETKQVIAALTENDTLPKFKVHGIMTKFLRAELGGSKVPAMIEKARKACMVYARQTQAYGKRWKGIEPDFCTPLNVALDEILGELDELRKLYP